MMKTLLLFVSLLAIGLWTGSDGQIMPSLCVTMPICNLPMEAGPCKAHMPSYYYDPRTNTCKRFIYGGCNGNANNFKTKAECEKQCKKPICNLPKVAGPCKAYMPRYHYDPRTNTCKRFIYGGCGGNANNFKTKAQCEKHCKKSICSLPKVSGSCRAYIPRYHYDPRTNTCKRFIYGGCSGNANNFKTKAACEKHCKKPCPLRCKAGYVCMWQQIVCKKAPCPPGRFTCVAICNLPKVAGPCKAYIPRYHYDPRTNTCKRFIYGGCGGNANNFKTKAACEKHCKKPCPIRCKAGYVCKWQQVYCIKAPCPPGSFTCVAVCGMPRVIGPCEARMPRYHYDTKTRSCVLFYYGGCGGNENNFKTKADCERTCKP